MRTFVTVWFALSSLMTAQLLHGCRTGEFAHQQVSPSDVGEGETVEVRLGELVPVMPVDADVRGTSYRVDQARSSADSIDIRGVSRVAVVTYEGKRYKSPAKQITLFLTRNRVRTVGIWALSHPMPFFDAVDWLERWLEDNGIEPDETLQQYFGFWRSAPRPGYESPGGLPRQEFVRIRLTPTSSLGIRWQPHPERDWILLLTISLTAEEMGKLRALEEQEDEAVD
jgi:hypothetical protein